MPASRKAKDADAVGVEIPLFGTGTEQADGALGILKRRNPVWLVLDAGHAVLQLPYLVWEWLVVEAIVRSIDRDGEMWGLPGSHVTRKSVDDYNYVDERSYLKTPRVFGFHGIYKRLAIHLGLVDSHLRFRAPRGEELVHERGRELEGQEYDERTFHGQLHAEAPEYGVVLDAIAAYESFCRNVADAFDIVRAEGSRKDVQGFEVPSLKSDAEFHTLGDRSHAFYEAALQQLSDVDPLTEATFIDRFERFSEPLPVEQFPLALCEHHEAIQREKSRDGKRPWFDRMGPDRIYVRQSYRVGRPPMAHDTYVHEYRTNPIRRFYRDLQ